METLLTLQVQVSLAILLTLLLRCCLTRLPRRWSYGLWIIVFLRLLIPVSLESPLGVLPGEAALDGIWQQTAAGGEDADMREEKQDAQRLSAKEGQPLILTGNLAQPENGGQGMAMAENGMTNEGYGWQPVSGPETENHTGHGSKMSRADILHLLLFGLWLTGLLIMLGYNLRAIICLRRQTRKAEMLEEGVFSCPELTTPFAIGMIRPGIYLPAAMRPEQRIYILCHERIHIRRKDYLVKGIAFLLTALYWYNPLVWVAFYMLEQDMEMSCDEAVVEGLGDDIRKAYSQSLLDFAVSSREAAMIPLTFGENSVKQRVKNILVKKRSGRWAVLAGGLVVTAAAVLIFTTRDSGGEEPLASRNEAADAQDRLQEIMNLQEEQDAIDDKIREEIIRLLSEGGEESLASQDEAADAQDRLQEIMNSMQEEQDAINDKIREEIIRLLTEDEEFQQAQKDYIGYPTLKPGDQVTELFSDVYRQIIDSEGTFYLNTRYGIYRKDKGADGDIYTCLFPRYIGYDARMTLHPNLDMLYFVTDSEYEEWSLDWYANCIMRLDLHTLETEVVAQVQGSGSHQDYQDWQEQIDAFYGVYNGKNAKQKSHEWEEMVEYWGEDILDQYELVRSLEADVADCPGDEMIEVYTLKADSELVGMYGGVVRILSGEGELLMTETADPPSPGRNSLYLGQRDGQNFLMNFYLEDRGTFGGYYYQVYRLTADGEIDPLNDSAFNWDYDESLGEKALLYNDEVFYDWAEKLQDYMEASQLLISTLEDEVETDPEVRPYRYNYDTLTRGHTGEGLKGRD